jgi:signal transduction histidine kinase
MAVLGLLVPQVSNFAGAAGRAADTDLAARVTGQFGVLLEDLQQERLLSVGYLLGVVEESALTGQSAQVAEQILEVRRNVGDDIPEEALTALDVVKELEPVRQRVRIKAATPDEVLNAFIPVLDGMIESLGLDELADLTSSTGRELITLDAILRLNETLTETTAILAVMAAGDPEAQAVRYHQEQAELEVFEEQFADYATPAQTEQYDLVSAAFEERLGARFDEDFERDPVATMRARPLTGLFPKLLSFSVLGGVVEKRLIEDLSAAVSREQRQALTLAYSIGGGAVLLLIVVLVLVAVVGRAVARPLIQLTRSAERVAEAGEAELRRIADDEAEGGEPIAVEGLDVSGNDEIGELARAFDRLQSTATQLVERQVLSRRNVAQMFGHIGRRTQNLVGRQVGLIDQLETQETDGPRLQQLYRLDHLSNRLRRTADSLVVISGADRGEDHLAPVRLMDVARLALAEIEEYTRVDVDVPLDLVAVPAVVSDLVLIVGELLENATVFSPPHTRASITARAVPGGVRVVVVDRGIGMSEERLAEENARFTRRERLDLVPTRVLGLFVVGRVARRHGFRVVLSSTPGGGVTATLDIGDAYFAGGRTAGHQHSTGGDRPVADRLTPGVAELEAMLTAAPVHDVAARHAAGAPRAAMHHVGAVAAGPAAQARPALAPAQPVVVPAQPVVAQAQPVAAPVPPARAPYEADPVRRAGDRMGDLRPWNAFGAGTRPVQADPAPEPPAPASVEPARPDGRHAAPLVTDAPRAATPAGAPPPQTSQSGLRRRVPGRQLPATPAPSVSSAPPSPAEALAARDLVEAFEAGVRRAEEITEVLPGRPAPAAGAAPPAWPLMPATSSPASPPPFASSASPVASAPPMPSGPAMPQVPPEPPPSAPPGPGGARGLRRRTPGATLDSEPLRHPPNPRWPAADQDPAAVRSLVEQYESGVARALRDTSGGTDTEEGASG